MNDEEEIKQLLKSLLEESEQVLTKYQARYHGATHAQKLWDRGDVLLKKIGAVLHKTSP